jgi:putative transposase
MSVKRHLSQNLENRNIYFVTFTILGWKNIFVEVKYIDLIYKWFDYQKKTYENKIHAYVIMPNHFHGIFYLSEKSPNIMKLIQNAKRFLAYEIIKLLKEDCGLRRGSPLTGDSLRAVEIEEVLKFFSESVNIKKNAKYKVFEDGFDCKVIYSKKFFLQKLNYIHKNPLQEHWRLTDQAEKFIYSSASNYILAKGKYEVDVITIV